MRAFKFAREIEFKTNGNVFRLKRLVEDVWQAENQRTGAYQQFSLPTLNQLYAEGKIELTEKPTYSFKTRTVDNELIDGYLDNLSADERDHVITKRYFLITYQKNYGSIKTSKAMTYAIDREWGKVTTSHSKPSASAALKWLSKFEKSGNDIRSLFPRFNQCGNRSKRISDDLESICLEIINQEYMNRQRHTLTHVLQKAIHAVVTENKTRPKSMHIQLPTISTLRSLIKTLPTEEIYASRFGNDAARLKYRTSIGSTHAEKPLSVVEADHTRLDVVGVDELTGLPIDRPWLTIIIDVRTRCILGFHLGYEPPSHATVAAALKHAIMPKVMHGSIRGNWPMLGIPEMMVVDNGLEFHGNALKALCGEIGINLSFCPRKRGWSKGSVERVIGTINRNISEMVPSGRTFHSIAARGDYDSVKQAAVSLEALRIGIAKYIVDVYHERFHRGIQCKPIHRWETYINNEDIRLPVNPNDLDAIVGQIETRSVFHYGIEINNATYNSEELMKYRSHFKSKAKAIVRWNAADLGHIYVMVPDGPTILVPVHPSKSYLKGMSYYAWKLIQNEMKSRQLNMNDPTEIAEMVHEITEMMTDNARKNKQTRQQHLRFKDGTKDIRQPKLNGSEIHIHESDLTVPQSSIYIPKLEVYQRNQPNNKAE
ncbi:MAG: Mu transposase C-terminal domain-containing protein [Methylotenera sp.]